MRSAGTGITIRQSMRLTFAMLFSSNFLPTTVGGDVVRLAGSIRLGFNQAISLASLVADRLVGMAGMAMALPFGIPSLIHLGSYPEASASLATPWMRGLTQKFQDFYLQITQAASVWLHKPRAVLGALVFTWVHMLCTFTTVWILLDGMGEHITFWLIMGLWSVGYFVTLLPISINGMGVQEVILTYLFVTFAGISTPSGVAMALLIRILQMLASLPGALFIPDILAGRK
jgi:uncharacterized membrane protein YbhN (UPF0104 family)